jgi:NitT/TauT family transport system ATP-binding protein
MLKVSGLCKHFGDLVVLENFNLTVPHRGFTILIGPSGCGKSIEKSLPHLGKKAAYMQQKDLLLPWFTLLDNALLPATIAGSDMTISNTKAQRLFKRLGLEGFENYLPAETSGGMRQRCALVRTLMFEHELVLLDEPLSALDAITRTSLQSLLLLLRSVGHGSIAYEDFRAL